MSYLIDINEEQRLALISLLQSHPNFRFIEMEGEVDHPLKYWVEMLKDMPNEKPGVIYGFCL